MVENFENNQAVDSPLDMPMDKEGSEDQVHSTCSSSSPFRGWNRDPRSHPSGEPGIGVYQAPGLREMSAGAGHFRPSYHVRMRDSRLDLPI